MKKFLILTLCIVCSVAQGLCADRCSDERFLRRAYLTVTGALPTVEQCIDFLDSSGENKREQLIDELIESELGLKYMQMRWGDILRIKSEFPSNLWPNGVQAYNRWIYEHLLRNTPYDRMVSELLLGRGSNFRDPAANFYRGFQSRSAENFYTNINLLFLGSRSYTDNGHFCFSQIKFKSTKEWKEEIVYLDYYKRLPWQRVKLSDGTELTLRPQTDWREAYVSWLTSKSNRRFAEVMANRMWYWVFGRGIVHEPDDWREDNKPTDPELLNSLTDFFIESSYDLRALMKHILMSEQFNSALFPAQRLPAEVIVDAIASVTGIWSTYSSRVPEPFTFYPTRTRSTHLGDATVSSSELELFGKVSRDVSLESQRNNTLTSRQLLYLMNSSVLEGRIRKSQPLQRIYLRSANISQLADNITLQVLSRRATEAEKAMYARYVEQHNLPLMEAAIDIMWMQINSNEFLYNH